MSGKNMVWPEFGIEVQARPQTAHLFIKLISSWYKRNISPKVFLISCNRSKKDGSGVRMVHPYHKDRSFRLHNYFNTSLPFQE
jgi:hypothetical protein